MTKKTIDNTSTDMGKIIRELVAFCLPLILSGVLQQLYNWADAFILGNVEGEIALAATGATNSTINLYVNLMIGMSAGIAILIGQKYGSGEYKIIHKILSIFAVLMGGFYLIAAAAGSIGVYPLMQALNTTPETIDLACAYLRVIFLGMPFLAVYNVYSAAIRGIGNSKVSFYAIVISSVSNVILDIVFVAGLHLGIQGAAAATIVSQIVMTIYIIVYTQKKYDVLRFDFKRESYDPVVLKKGLQFGLPPMLQQSITSCGNLVLTNFMNGFGTTTVIAITTSYRVDTLALLPIINLGAAIATFTAQSYGSGNKKRTERIFFVGNGVMAAAALILTLIVVPWGSKIVALFGAGPEAMAVSHAFFKRLASFYIIFALGQSLRGYIEGLGDVFFSSMIGIGGLFVRIACSYLLIGLFGNMVIAIAEGISWCILLILYIIRWRVSLRKKLEKDISAA